MRNLVQNHFKYVIDNGTVTSIWYDNWSHMGPLINSITHRIIYDDARLNKLCSVADMIENGSWRWSNDW